MATKFNMTRDINGYNGFGLQFTDTAYSCTLTTGTDTTLLVPSASGLGGNGMSSSSLWIAVFSYDPGTSVWVSLNSVASNPAGATFAVTASELNPAARQVRGIGTIPHATYPADVLHFYTTGTGVNVSVIFYSIS
jgi:hypothetical protein